MNKILIYSEKQNLMKLLILFTLLFISFSQYLTIQSPQEFVSTFSNSRLVVKASPIGFKPKAGILNGKIALAQPASACTQIKQLSLDDQTDIFIMADDAGCLQSVKALNLAASGTYVGIIKQNINNTLHDKEINVVHIPILQILPNDYDRIVSYMLKNPDQSISVLLDFNEQRDKKIHLELWLSPTQVDAYSYIIEMRDFILNQKELIWFQPRFVLHSKTNRRQYVGCYSSGRFCPPQLQYEGKPEGAKIVSQTLRQIIIADKNIDNWFNYAYYYYFRCLKQKLEGLWQQRRAEMCSENVMLGIGIDSEQIFSEFNKSFHGPRPQVDGNIYLQQERQLYIQQKITKFPIILLNGKQQELEDSNALKIRICNMISPNPEQQTQQCRKITNPKLFSNGQIVLIIAAFISVIGVLMFGCRHFIYKRMKKEMKGEVDKTLSQYYRYMETLQQPNPSGKKPLVQSTVETNQIGSIQLQQYKGNK